MNTRAPALVSGLALMRQLATATEPVQAAVLATRLDLPRSSVYHLLGVLTEAGFVVHYPEDHAYGLGLGAFEIGTGYLRQARLERLGRPVLVGLVRSSRATAHLGILLGQELLYLVKQEAPHSVGLVTDVGVRLPAHLTASGRALLAALPVPEFHAIYPASAQLADRTGSGPTTVTALRQLIDTEREAGRSEEDGHVSPGIGSVAVAVRDRTGRPVVAISVSVRSRELAARRSRLVAETGRAAALLGRRLG
ncbi:MAG: IclR family transcriptional regulator [Actinomycetota bacterium]|nr:IclR family transcriptional regulator [Actinomycetota bacterium]MDQ2956114.1 IclR family transcriptional regulator [Actinomycetota bacterium]